MPEHRIGTQEEWQAARDEVLREEKELTRRSDELAGKRRELPWVPVEKDYRFETEQGAQALADLFDGRSQLIVYHFMFGPGLSVYALSDGNVYRTYVTTARGLEIGVWASTPCSTANPGAATRARPSRGGSAAMTSTREAPSPGARV